MIETSISGADLMMQSALGSSPMLLKKPTGNPSQSEAIFSQPELYTQREPLTSVLSSPTLEINAPNMVNASSVMLSVVGTNDSSHSSQSQHSSNGGRSQSRPSVDHRVSPNASMRGNPLTSSVSYGRSNPLSNMASGRPSSPSNLPNPKSPNGSHSPSNLPPMRPKSPNGSHSPSNMGSHSPAGKHSPTGNSPITARGSPSGHTHRPSLIMNQEPHRPSLIMNQEPHRKSIQKPEEDDAFSNLLNKVSTMSTTSIGRPSQSGMPLDSSQRRPSQTGMGSDQKRPSQSGMSGMNGMNLDSSQRKPQPIGTSGGIQRDRLSSSVASGPISSMGESEDNSVLTEEERAEFTDQVTILKAVPSARKMSKGSIRPNEAELKKIEKVLSRVEEDGEKREVESGCCFLFKRKKTYKVFPSWDAIRAIPD